MVRACAEPLGSSRPVTASAVGLTGPTLDAEVRGWRALRSCERFAKFSLETACEGEIKVKLMGNSSDGDSWSQQAASHTPSKLQTSVTLSYITARVGVTSHYDKPGGKQAVRRSCRSFWIWRAASSEPKEEETHLV